MIIDDNHLLVEWLAYHYHVLPLKRLIVGVDPRSKTSPSAILDRYRHAGLMKITEWHEYDMMPPHLLSAHRRVNQSDFEALKALYITRQIEFYTKCMATLKLENVAWAAMTDTDEYILINRFAKESFRLKHTENMTVYQILSNPENRRSSRMIKTGCLSMPRLQFGHKESDTETIQKMIPSGFNASLFSTMRWRYHASRTDKQVNKLAKCLINLRRARDSDFVATEVSPHRPIKRLCDIANMYKLNAESPFVVNHYSGSWEQWNYRDDFRPKRLRENFDSLYFDNEVDQDDSIRPWLNDFVKEKGPALSSLLLDGIGRLEPKS